MTGIKPTGSPHIGNFLGAIKPAIELSEKYDARYFIADYHALNSIKDPRELKKLTLEIAACWLACGLDPDKVIFYRQSDVPEVFELTTMLMSFAPKGRLNGAHAYKAATALNVENSQDPDKAINMGMFTYPVLMAADILLFDADVVPIGKDQIQHLEITADIAQVINFNYKNELFKIPKPLHSEDTHLVTGLDGRKMSKSYNNTIPIFNQGKSLRKTIMKISTNSQGIEEKKDPETCNVFSLYKLFTGPEQQKELAERYRQGGMGWGEAKEELFMVMEKEMAPFQEKYFKLLDKPEDINSILKEGATKARILASEKIKTTRKILGFE